jgi:hypothetical protein
MGEARRKFDKDFREGAVRLVRETGKPVPVGAGNSVTLCDLRIFMDQASEPVAA